MNKYLLMSAAAVLSTSATAYAAPHAPSATGHTSFYETTGGGGAYCNEWSVSWTGGVYYANRDSLAEYCGSAYAGATGVGAALKGKVHGLGKVIQLPSDVLADSWYGDPYLVSNFTVEGGKIQNGSTMIGFGTSSGYSMYEFSISDIFLGQANKVRPGQKQLHKPVQEKLIAYAKAHAHK